MVLMQRSASSQRREGTRLPELGGKLSVPWSPTGGLIWSLVMTVHRLHSRAFAALLACAALMLVDAPAAHASDAQPRVQRRAKVKRSRSAPARPARGRAPKAKKIRGKKHTKFESGTPMWTVRQAFHCVLDFDESSGFDCYVPLNVEINRHNHNARIHLRRYQWRHFRKYAASYVGKGKTFSVRVTRFAPANRSAKSNRIKVFLSSRHRDNPAPITLKREGSSWLIYNNSL